MGVFISDDTDVSNSITPELNDWNLLGDELVTEAAAEPLNVVLIDGSLDSVDNLVAAQVEQDRVMVYDASAESATGVLARVTDLAEESGQPIESLARSVTTDQFPRRTQAGSRRLIKDSRETAARYQ